MTFLSIVIDKIEIYVDLDFFFNKITIDLDTNLNQISSGSTGIKAISSLVLPDIYWTHKWYISVLPKIYQLTFSAAPPLLPKPV